MTLPAKFALLILFIACTAGSSAAEEIKILKPGSEQQERQVDQVASASQQKAIAKLKTLLRKFRGTRQEPILLSKLADLQQQQAAILFRIAHGKAQQTKKALDLTRFSKTLKDSIRTLDHLIRAYPHYEEIPHAYFLRAKAYEEMSNKPAAIRDYLHLVTKFPKWEENPSAYMSLADFAIEANDHPKAIIYLKEVEKLPNDPHYPFALYKLAWSHYNLKNIPTALGYAERQIDFYRGRKSAEGDGILGTSDSALRENTLLDATVFYIEGYEEKLAEYTLGDALPYFRKLETGPILGKMLVRFAKLLRSHGHEADLIAWKDQVLLAESDRPETLDILLITYELQLNRHRYSQLIESSRDIVRLYLKRKETMDFSRAQRLLTDTAEGLQALIIKNKAADEVRSLSVTLATIYDAFTKIVAENDPRVPKVHYNLAETLFVIKDFTGATEHYRWVIEHGPWNADASLKAISSRYEVLLQKQLIPKTLDPVSFKKDSSRELDPLLSQWTSWIDVHLDKQKGKTDPKFEKIFENFAFEANRALYAQGRIRTAVERMRTFARSRPASAYAIPSASLAIDTYIASAEWENTHDLANSFLKVPEWNTGKGTDFSKRLFGIAADSFYKIIEARYRAHDYAGAIKGADKFLKYYSSSVRLADTLSIAGRSSVKLNDKTLAMNYFSKLISEAGKSDSVGEALLSRASIGEDRYDLAAAATDYRLYLSLPPAQMKASNPDKLDDLRAKALMLTWLSGDPADMRATLNSKAICNEALAEQCEKISILVALASPEKAGDEGTTKDAFDRARKKTGDLRTLWAALALEGAKHLSFRDRLMTARFAANGWDDLDPLFKFTLLPYLSSSIPRSFYQNRLAMREVAPLRANEKYIARRVEVIREMENSAAKVIKLPWSRIRAEVLNEIALLYLDLSKELAKMPAPKNLEASEMAAYDEVIRKLVMPFEEKGQEMRSKAFEIASRFSIEEKPFASIVEPFFADNPAQAKALKPTGRVAPPMEINVDFLAKLDGSTDWEDLHEENPANTEEPAERIKILWVKALLAKRWQQVAFYMQEAQEKALIEAGVMAAVKAVSLAAAGARGEALAELEDSRKDLNPQARTIAMTTLIQYSVQSCARERTKDLLKEIQADQLSREQARAVQVAADYATPALPNAPKTSKQ